MKNQYIPVRLLIVVPLAIVGYLLGTCAPPQEKPASVNGSTQLTAPQVTVLANLPDSSQPKVTLLADRPKPKVTLNTKPGKIHSFIDPRTKLPVAPEVQGTGFFTHYTTDNGLASDQIACSIMDKTGVLWFGSFGGGVSRYDGKTFTTYAVAQGLANNVVRSILEDRAGNLWFGTDGAGVSKFDGKRFITYSTAQGLANNYVYSSIEDKAGNLWFATLGGGVSKYDGKTFTNYSTKEGLAHNVIWTVLEDKAGNLWFSTDGGGVSKFDGKRFTTYTTAQGLADNDVFSILEDTKGNLWFGTMGSGLSKYDGQTFTTYSTAQGLVDNSIISCLEDKAGNLWFGSLNGGVSKYDGRNFTNFTTTQGLAHNGVSGITEDKHDNIWFGTIGGGVSKYGGGSFTRFTKAQGLENGLIGTILEDKRGDLWFGLSQAGVVRYDGDQFATYTTAQGLTHNNIYNGVVDKAGNLWFGTDGAGGIKFDGKRFTTYTTAQGLADNTVSPILEDKAGILWFGTLGGGVSRFDGKRFTTYKSAQGLANNFVNCILEDQRGNFWFGTNNGGVSKFDGERFTTYTTAQGLASNNILIIIEDKTGNLLFGTEQGLSVILSERLSTGKENLKEPLFKPFITTDELPDKNIIAIAEDNEGKLLVGSGLGVAVLKEGIRSFDKPGAIELYSSTTGYPMKGVNSLFADSKGIIWIATSSDKTGLVRFDEKAVHKTRNPPVLVLQSIKLNNEAICWNDLLPASTTAEKSKQSDSLATPAHVTEEVTAFGRALRETERDSLRSEFSGVEFDSVARWYPIPINLVLPHRHNSLTFAFNAIETSRNFMVRYQYKLDGFDDEWSSIKEEASATFGNLFEGTYTLNVKARSPEGVWSQPLSYTFTVLPPWWRTWWAYLLYALAAVGAIGAFVAYRSRALRRENRILEEKVTIRTAEVVQQKEEIATQRNELEQTLTNLKTTQTQLVQKEKMASLGELTAGIAHEIQNPLNFVNNFSELSSDIVEELEEEHQKSQRDADLEVELLTDLKDNLHKILHHGNRAASIVKGMLEHARSSNGEMAPTDLNKLADEFLRLAYHGMRGNDKNFNCELVTEFDSGLGLVTVMPQEIGRVLLNLFNNAFYAVRQQQRTKSDGTYQPRVRVTTGRVNGQAVITVGDNGMGMSEGVKAKIFQPFFTTKPTGEGTGLGLSLSYDIITKGHRGSLTVESQEGKGAEFVMILPGASTFS